MKLRHTIVLEVNINLTAFNIIFKIKLLYHVTQKYNFCDKK